MSMCEVGMIDVSEAQGYIIVYTTGLRPLWAARVRRSRKQRGSSGEESEAGRRKGEEREEELVFSNCLHLYTTNGIHVKSTYCGELHKVIGKGTVDKRGKEEPASRQQKSGREGDEEVSTTVSSLPLHSLTCWTRTFRSAKANPTDEILLAGTCHGRVLIYRLCSLSLVGTYDLSPSLGEENPITSIHISPTEEVLVVGTQKGTITLQPLPTLVLEGPRVSVVDIGSIDLSDRVSAAQGAVLSRVDTLRGIAVDVKGAASEVIGEAKGVASKLVKGLGSIGGKWFKGK